MARNRPTMIDVARDAGVSLKTVSRVINSVTTVDAELAERVRTSVEKLGFRRNAVAASLRAGSSDMIGLVTADLANPFYTQIASAVSTVSITHGSQVIMASTEENPAVERRITLDLCQRRVGGLIVVPSAADQGYLADEARHGTRVVFVDRPGTGIDADAVLLDNRGGARAGAAELRTRGHRRIALLFDDLGIYTMAERLAGVRETLDGLLADELFVASAHSPAAAEDAMHAMLKLPDPPTAVFCANNRATVGAVEAVLETGSTIDIVGFDDFELSRLLPVPVTLIAYETAELGRIAAETLFARIAGDDSPATSTLIPTRLVQRGVQR